MLVQLALKGDQLLEFLADSGDRVAHVPWYYYLDKLISFEGFVTPLIWLIGIGLAVKRWTTGDRLLLFWVLVAAVFFQFYPLKAFNYVLPLIPALSVLAGRAVHDIAIEFVAWSRRPRRIGARLGLSVGRTATVLAGCAIFAATASPVLAVGEVGLVLRPARGGDVAEEQHVQGRGRDDAVEGIRAVRAVVLRQARRVPVRAVPARHDRPRWEGAESEPRRRTGRRRRTGARTGRRS